MALIHTKRNHRMVERRKKDIEFCLEQARQIKDANGADEGGKGNV